MGYRRRVDRQGGKRYRRCADTKNERQKKKLFGKTNWFKKKGKERGQQRDRDTKDRATRRYY